MLILMIYFIFPGTSKDAADAEYVKHVEDLKTKYGI